MGGPGSGRPEPAPRDKGGRYKGTGWCFVATAVYGDPEHEKVHLLRQFRDSRLLQSRVGRQFVRCYYLVGPWFGRRLERSPVLRRVCRRLLDRICSRLTGERKS